MSDAETIEEIDYEIGQDNVEIFGLDIHNPVFMVSALSIIALVLLTLMFQEGAAEMFGALRPWLTSTFDWVFMGAANIFVLFCLLLVVTPLGRVRLGGVDAKPDYSYAGWFSMLFAAGMGIGLMFFGVLEPVYHFQNPPLGVDADNTEAARAMGMAATIFHWGWTLFGMVWSIAIAGMVMELIVKKRYKSLSLGLYLGLGWLVMIAIGPMLDNVAPGGLILLLAGGLFYSLGVIFYVWKTLVYHHAIWHLFVLAGSAFHFFAVLLYVIPGAEAT